MKTSKKKKLETEKKDKNQKNLFFDRTSLGDIIRNEREGPKDMKSLLHQTNRNKKHFENNDFGFEKKQLTVRQSMWQD